MDDSTRATVLAAAEELFDRDTLYRLASSVGEARQRKTLRFWQEELLSEFSQYVGVDVTKKSQFIAAFKGTADRYYTPLSPVEQAKLDEAQSEVRDELDKIAKAIRRTTQGSERILPPGTSRQPLNDNAGRIGFQVTFSLRDLVESLFRGFHDVPDKHDQHACCELIRAHHLGAKVSESKLSDAINRSLNATIEYLSDGKTNIDGWYRQLRDGIFLSAYCGDSDTLAALCAWATPRKKLDYEGRLDDEIQQLYLVLASLFQDKPNQGFRRLLTTCVDSRKTRIRLLANIVDAIRTEDQDAFETATRKAVQNYRKRKPADANLALLSEWLPVHINTAYYAGLCRGMNTCNFKDNVAVYLCGPIDGVETVR